MKPNIKFGNKISRFMKNKKKNQQLIQHLGEENSEKCMDQHKMTGCKI